MWKSWKQIEKCWKTLKKTLKSWKKLKKSWKKVETKLKQNWNKIETKLKQNWKTLKNVEKNVDKFEKNLDEKLKNYYFKINLKYFYRFWNFRIFLNYNNKSTPNPEKKCFTLWKVEWTKYSSGTWVLVNFTQVLKKYPISGLNFQKCPNPDWPYELSKVMQEVVTLLTGNCLFLVIVSVLHK